MNLFLTELFNNLNPNKKGFKRKVLSFTVFLVIATFFWFLNALGEKYTEDISYPVRYINLPENKAETTPLPKSLDLKITADGYKLLDHFLSATVRPIIIDYKAPDVKTLAMKSGQCKYVLSVNQGNKVLKAMKDIEIHSIGPDTIKFNFFPIQKKKVPVKALATYKLKNGYVEKGEMFTDPDSIEISGPKNLVEKITEVYTGRIKLDVINETTKRNVAIKRIDKVKFDTYRSNVTIPIEQSTEKVIELPIQVNNTFNDNTIDLIPNTVQLSYKVGLSEYTKISNDQFNVQVNYNELNKDDKVLKVVLSKHPGKVYEIEFTPKFVEYLKKKND